MLIESIKLENFRQFQMSRLLLRTALIGKNVTIILGENGKAVKPTICTGPSFGVCTVKRLSPTSGCSIPKLPAR